MPDVIAPGALIEVRDALWRVLKVDRASTGRAVWTVTGVSSPPGSGAQLAGTTTRCGKQRGRTRLRGTVW